MAPAGGRGVHPHDRPPRGLLQPPALLRPGPAGGIGQVAGSRLRVATYNVRAAIGPGPFPPAWFRRVDRARLARIARIVAGFEADIVALQEVPMMTVDGDPLDLTAELAAATGMAARYASVAPAPLVELDGRVSGAYLWGNALLARGSFLAARTVALPVAADDDRVEPPDLDHPLAGVRYADAEPGVREPRCALVARVAVDSLLLTAVTTHFTYMGSGQRLAQAAALAAAIEGESDPLVVLGDLNAPIESPGLAPLRERLVDAFEAVGVPPGDERRISCEVHRIDHVLVRGLTVRDCRVVREVGDESDHWPVVADLEAA